MGQLLKRAFAAMTAISSIALIILILSKERRAVGEDEETVKASNTTPISSQTEARSAVTHKRTENSKQEVKLIKMKVGVKSKNKNSKTITCGNHKCIIQHGGQSGEADMSVFTVRSVVGYVSPPRRSPGELWVFHSTEPQWLRVPSPSEWDGLFNYSVTYLSDTVGASYNFADKFIKRKKATINFASRKSERKAVALWFVSHCAQKHRPTIGSARAFYVLELSKYFHVEAFSTHTSCKTQLGKLVTVKPRNSDPPLRKYTFYLAFENSLCRDYITEKLWKVLEAPAYTIPVVLGGLSIEEYTKAAPPNSFIHVKNFTSPKALADHLKYVAENDDAFNYYLQWRNEYILKNAGMYTGSSCYMCKLAHEKPTERWDTFSKDFGSHNCLDISAPSDYCSYYNMTCNKRNGL